MLMDVLSGKAFMFSASGRATATVNSLLEIADVYPYHKLKVVSLVSIL